VITGARTAEEALVTADALLEQYTDRTSVTQDNETLAAASRSPAANSTTAPSPTTASTSMKPEQLVKPQPR
jgi:hypothetical protein